MLARANIMLGVALCEDAGRAAYLACFHVAQALIFEREDRVFKAHHGLQTEFQRLTKDDPRVEPDLRAFLSRAYKFKTIADYAIGAELTPTADDARTAIETAERFVAAFTRLAASGPAE